jgi:heme exporter protein C
MHSSMMAPLIWMAIGVKLMFGAALLDRARNDLLEQDRRKGWIRRIVDGEALGERT